MGNYSYRKLTPEERAEVIRLRSLKKYPLHAPPHLFRDEGYYAITAANFEHKPIMDSAHRRSGFEEMLFETLATIEAEVSGWVILPNHYHLLLMVKSLDDLSAAIKQLHGRSSRIWNLEEGKTGNRKVWYKFFDRKIRDEAHFYRILNYIHFNPAKHQYVTDPYEWLWTSLHGYSEDKGPEWLRQKWVDYRPEGETAKEFQE